MGFGWQEIDKTLDLGYIRVAGLHCGCKPAVLFEPPNFRPRTITHIHMYVPFVLFLVCSFVLLVLVILLLQVFNKMLSLASTACDSISYGSWSNLLLSVSGVSPNGGGEGGGRTVFTCIMYSGTSDSGFSQI